MQETTGTLINGVYAYVGYSRQDAITKWQTQGRTFNENTDIYPNMPCTIVKRSKKAAIVYRGKWENPIAVYVGATNKLAKKLFAEKHGDQPPLGNSSIFQVNGKTYTVLQTNPYQHVTY